MINKSNNDLSSLSVGYLRYDFTCYLHQHTMLDWTLLVMQYLDQSASLSPDSILDEMWCNKEPASWNTFGTMITRWLVWSIHTFNLSFYLPNILSFLWISDAIYIQFYQPFNMTRLLIACCHYLRDAIELEGDVNLKRETKKMLDPDIVATMPSIWILIHASRALCT